MRRFSKYLIIVSILLLGLSSCNDDKLRDAETTITELGDPEVNKWIKENLTDIYNIDVQYVYNQATSDQGVDLTPPKADFVPIFLKVMIRGYVRPYNEVSRDPMFLKKNSARVWELYGSSHSNGAQATADNGFRITCFDVNTGYFMSGPNFVKSKISWYMHTFHHEFVHILNQRVKFQDDYKAISGADYDTDYAKYTLKDVLDLGFISKYSRMNSGEDFAELVSIYVTSTPAEWDALVAQASEEGAKKINAKLGLAKSYMNTNFEVDLQQLRDKVLEAIDDIVINGI